MLSQKHLLNVIILGAPLLVGMISEFFMLIGGFFSKKWLEVSVESDRMQAEA